MGFWLWTLLIMVIIWTILWKLSSVARYYLKFTTFTITSVISACCPIPLMLLRPGDSRNALLPAAGARFAAKYFIGLDSVVKGKENIVKDSGCVVLINHQSVLDLVVLAELWPIMDKCTVISKKEIFYLWPFGLAAWLWGTIFIDRLNAERAQSSINNTGKTIRDRKARVLMFPEGTRSLQKKLLPFKKGAFHLAIASQCPIQPVVVNRYTFLGNQRFDDGVIDITILPPIETKGLVKEDITSLIDKTYNVMSDYLENMSTSPNNNIDKLKDN